VVPDLIDRTDRSLRANRPDYYARLRPGVVDARLDEFERRFGVTLPEAFRLLYKWKDGQDATFSQPRVSSFPSSARGRRSKSSASSLRSVSRVVRWREAELRGLRSRAELGNERE
jgi:cell wall assembly regulator SMI1